MMPKLYVVGGELWLEGVRLQGETDIGVFSQMDEETLTEAVELILKAVGLTLEPTRVYLRANDTSSDSGPFTLESLEIRDTDPDFVGREFATYGEADEFITANKIDAEDGEAFELVSRWGNTVEWPYYPEEDE